MANLYGVANAPQITFQILSFGSTTTCNANVITPVLTSGAITAPSQGWFQVIAWLCLRIINGATTPTGLAFQMAIGAGSYNNATQIGGQGLTPSASNYITAMCETVPAQTAWMGAGSTVTFGVTAQTNSTQIAADSCGLLMLMRTADQ